VFVWNITSGELLLEFSPFGVSLGEGSYLSETKFVMSESFIVLGKIDRLSIFDIKTGHPTSYSPLVQEGYTPYDEYSVFPALICSRNNVLFSNNDSGIELRITDLVTGDCLGLLDQPGIGSVSRESTLTKSGDWYSDIQVMDGYGLRGVN
jgi:hypothetical protein